jgi:F0F1-type ATP synthase membrane subunit b/b'
MELIVGLVVVVGLAAFFLWPKVSEKIDDFQEEMDDARESVEEKIEEVVEDVKEDIKEAIDALPSASDLKKLTKAKLEELGRELGIELDKRKTKDNMIKELQEKSK